MKIDYEYGVFNPGTGQVMGGTNSGNIGKQKITVPAVDVNTNSFSNTTDYEFDAVDNLIRDILGRQFR